MYIHADDICQAEEPIKTIQVFVVVTYASESSHTNSRLMSCWRLHCYVHRLFQMVVKFPCGKSGHNLKLHRNKVFSTNMN